MAKTEYEIIWKKGGWFEKGHFALVPKKSFSDKAGEALIGYLLLLVVILFILSIILLTAPIWVVVLGYQMVREKRYYAGLASLLALGYFYFDISKKWLTSFLFFGYTDSEGKFVEGLFNLKYLQYLETANIVAVGLGIGYIIDSILISEYGKKFKDDRITMPQVVVYLFPVIFCFIILKHLPNRVNSFPIRTDIENSSFDSNIYTEPSAEILSESIDTTSDIVQPSELIRQMPSVPDQYELSDLVFDQKPDTWYIVDKKTGHYGMIDREGQIILPAEYWQKFDYHINADTGKIFAVGMRDNRYGIIDINNNLLINFDFIDFDISDEMGYVSLKTHNNKWGMINTNLEKDNFIIIPFNYDELKRVYSGRKCDGIMALKNGQWGYLDLNGNIILDFAYSTSDKLFDSIRKS